MPLPSPQPNEDHGEFIERCMDDENIQADFDTEQALAVCETIWENET